MTLLTGKPNRAAALLRKFLLTVVMFVCYLPALYAGPGAHGPDGEHLEETETTQLQVLQPRFETFSEEFEVVGELQPHQLVIHVHDYQTNQPVTDADIEIETGELSSKAVYIAEKNHYQVTEQAMLSDLQHSGTHEIILTIISAEHADLLTATFENTTLPDDDHLHQPHSDTHFWWWSVPLIFAAFGCGLLIGRHGGAK